MSLTLQLSPELEAKLREQATIKGKQLESFVLEAIEDKLAVSDPPPSKLPFDKWQRQFREWMASLPPGNPNVDYSRESVYEGRGE